MLKKPLVIALILIIVSSVIVSLVSSVIVSSSLYLKTLRQEEERTKIQDSLEKLQLNYNSLKDTYTQLNIRYNALKNESISMNKSFQKAEVELDIALNKLEDFEAKVKESMEWFKKNSNIKNYGEYNKVEEQLKNECMEVKNEPSLCKINLGCIYKVNKDNEFLYKTDEALTGRDDFLKSLDLIYYHKGGDCEDISLLFTAEYNFLVEECKKANYTMEEVRPFLEEKGILAGNYMYTICGDFNPGGIVEDYAGHCVVAIVASPIEDSSDIYTNLKDGILVEPQSGEYLFDLNNTKDIYLFRDGESPDTLYHIYFVITEDDLKIFYKWSEKIEWIGYSQFLKEAQNIKGKIRGR